ncbi:MAG: hypothetical protein OXM61_24775 [Candidatus Poribacteria bacterium]|nr:hypothetical protein [Candidatus Poribacteria bacterium]
MKTVLERADFQFIEFVEGELTTVEVRRTDNLIKVQLGNELVLVHIEFQVGDSTNPEMVRRNVGYIGRCYEKYGLPILSHVIYLRPNAGRNDPGGYKQDVPNHRFIVEYKVIRLIQLDGQSVFETENIGLMPFAPLMQSPDSMEDLQWAIQCNERTKTLSLPTDIRSNLLVSQWVMSGLIHPHQAIDGFLSEEVMQESSVYQHLVETAEASYQREARQDAIRYLFAVLEFRFDGFAVQTLRPVLENIQDLERLQELHNEALHVENFEAFTHILSMNGNE